MPDSFSDILSRGSVFNDRNVLSPHYLPENLPHREKEINKIMRAVLPALKGQRPHNIFIYGKTGTGKTSSVKYVMAKFSEMKSNSAISHINCRIYNSRYRILNKIVAEHAPKFAKPGFGMSFLYEKILDWVEGDGKHFIVILDEIDMVRDLDDLVYTLTRANDDLTKGGISIIGISNKLSFKDRLDPRSRSSLLETELVFPPYNSHQLQSILEGRVKLGFVEGVVKDSAINLAAAIASQETGDARYALQLLLKAGEIVDEAGGKRIDDKDVELARKSVDEDVAYDAISTLPEHQQVVLYAVASLTVSGSRYQKLSDNDEGYLLSGEVYEGYLSYSRKLGKKPRSARWFRQYLSDLEMLGLITMVESGKGQRGHTRLISIAYSPEKVRDIIEKSIS